MKSKRTLLTAVFFMTVSNIALAEKTLNNCSFVYGHGKMSESSCITSPVADGSTDKKTLSTYFKARMGSLPPVVENDSIALDTLSWKNMGSSHCEVLDSPKNREALLNYMKNPFMKYVNAGGSSAQIAFDTKANGGNCNPIFIYFKKI